MKIQERDDYEKLLDKIESMPFFAARFFNYKLNEEASPSSLLEYSRDYEKFFNWALSACNWNKTSINEISVSDLNSLTVRDIYQFEEYLRITNNMKDRSILRKICSVRSLFSYLHDIEEDLNGAPLLPRNVFRKFQSKRLTTPKAAARDLQDKILHPKDIDEFISFVREGYSDMMKDNLQAIYSHEFNAIRDTCIVSLLLRSGLVLSDIVNLNVDDVFLPQSTINITRQKTKNRTIHTVFCSQTARKDLEKYIKIRENNYRPNAKEKAVFLAIPNGQTHGTRMTKRAIQAMVIKYATKFGRPEVTARQLSHSFGLNYYISGDLFLTRQQLAQRSIESTETYMYLAEMMSDGLVSDSEV